jgi:hypothetical protein
MRLFGRHFFRSLGHLSDEILSRMINDELGSLRDVRAESHLANCWQCRARFEQLEKAALLVVEYRKSQLADRLPLDPRRRDSFLTAADKLFTEANASSWWQSFALRLGRTPRAGRLTPFLASAGVVVLCLGILFLIWQRSLPPVSAAELLDRAQLCERECAHAAASGIVFQKVRIKTARHTMERDLYIDHSGQRKARAKQINGDVASLRASLEGAGVNWEEPLSAAAYRAWHDKQVSAVDHVSRSGQNLFTLTTKLSGGNVHQESLTVREEDFRPVRRTVEFEDFGTVEIAELNYAVLGRETVNEVVFEPLPAPPVPAPRPAVVAAARPDSVPLVYAPPPPSPDELDESELRARVVLNRYNADTKEQVRISRSDAEIEIKGVVETDQRKSEIASELRAIPNVAASFLSFEELRDNPSESSPMTSIKEYSLAGRPSPLARYMKGKGASPSDMSSLSSALLDSSLALEQNSAGLSELLTRFADPTRLSPEAQSARRMLIADFLKSVEAGAAEQATLLTAHGFTDATDSGSTSVPEQVPSLKDTLLEEAKRNQALCRQLIAGDEETQRGAMEIAQDLFASIARIRSLMAQF